MDNDPERPGGNRRSENRNNVEYLLRKPGFYKKGSGEFMLYFGTLDELMDKAEEIVASQDAKKCEQRRQHLHTITDEPDDAA